MSRKKAKCASNKIVGRCLESDAHAQTIDEGFAFLDRPILKPREALAYQWALRNIALQNLRIKSESTRDAIDNGTSYFFRRCDQGEGPYPERHRHRRPLRHR